VTEVIAVEPEPTLRAEATKAAASTSVAIRVLRGVADHLPIEDESVDGAVASLVLG
jgi:ubiquinone/menaquinone biosynthesis C-methylase UbiE